MAFDVHRWSPSQVAERSLGVADAVVVDDAARSLAVCKDHGGSVVLPG